MPVERLVTHRMALCLTKNLYEERSETGDAIECSAAFERIFVPYANSELDPHEDVEFDSLLSIDAL